MIKLETSMGDIVIELDEEKAPKSAANFLQYVEEGHYDGTIFHRVIDGFMVQGGGMTADMESKPTRDPIENEADNGLSNDPYTVAMARTMDPHSATAPVFHQCQKERLPEPQIENARRVGLCRYWKSGQRTWDREQNQRCENRPHRHARRCARGTPSLSSRHPWWMRPTWTGSSRETTAALKIFAADTLFHPIMRGPPPCLLRCGRFALFSGTAVFPEVPGTTGEWPRSPGRRFPGPPENRDAPRGAHLLEAHVPLAHPLIIQARRAQQGRPFPLVHSLDQGRQRPVPQQGHDDPLLVPENPDLFGPIPPTAVSRRPPRRVAEASSILAISSSEAPVRLKKKRFFPGSAYRRRCKAGSRPDCGPRGPAVRCGGNTAMWTGKG